MRKIIYLLAVVLISGVFQSALAQRAKNRPTTKPADDEKKSATDLRKEKLELEAANKVFDDKDADFKVKDIPEKWKNESAVVLAQKSKYEYTAEGNSLNFVETKRKRIKLLDKAAVEEFSKFYYYQTGNDYKVGIRVVKGDGKTKNIGTSEAVEVTNNVPAFFASRIYNFRVKYYKVAIADLEIGDIIDFFSEVHGSGYNFSGSAQTLSPIFVTLNGTYPILKARYDFTAEKGYYINFKTLNGAPDLKKNANVDRRTFSFTLEDKDRERSKDVRWLYELRRLPSIKFQVCYAKIGAESEQFLGKVGEPTKSVTPQQIAQKVNFYYNENIPTASKEQIQGYMKKNHRNVKDPMEYLKIAYYYWRHDRLIEGEEKGAFVSDDNGVRDDYFVPLFRELLKDLKVDAQVVVSAPRSLSAIDDIIMFYEMSWCLKVKDKFLFPFNSNSNPFEMDPSVEGCDAYTVDINKRDAQVKFKKITIPASSATDNIASETIDAAFDDNKENLKVETHSVVKGLLKTRYDFALRHTDYLADDYKYHGGEKPEEEVTRNKTKMAERDRKETARLDEQKKDKDEQMKEERESDFNNVVSFDEFTLEDAGRSPESNVIKYSEKFTLGEMIKKAGPNYAVDIPSLIGKQIDIKTDEKERDHDVFINNPQTFDYTINFTLPSGYKAEGLDALKFNVDNAAGSFISTAKMEGNKLVITAKKSYKAAFVKKEDWNNMIAFLDAAFNFTQKKIILKKG